MKWSSVWTLLIFLSSVQVGFTAEKYLIKLKSEKIHEVLDKASKKIKLSSALTLAIEAEMAEIGVFKVQGNDLINFILKNTKLSEYVEYIEKDATVRMIETSEASAEVTPNDKYYDKEQNALKRMSVNQAWTYTTGKKEVVVAVSDTGINYKHEDLKNQMWVNAGEIAGNKIDDDQNGLVDDVYGYDYRYRDSDPNDDQSHGSHVSGSIGAETNNGSGIAGINWNTSLMAVKFLGSDGSGSTSSGIETILYAVKNGAKLINCSWGGNENSKALKDAIDYAYTNGTLVIAAAGNDGESNETLRASYPAAYDSLGVVGVASSESDGRLSSFTNTGRFAVDLVAPGENIMSTVLGNGSYGAKSGTSMATPHVTGVAALILSLADLSTKDLRNALLNAVDERKDYKDYISTRGDINALKAVKQLSEGFQVWPGRVTLKTNSTYPFSVYAGQGVVNWSVDKSDVASIDAEGTLTTTGVAGEIVITATDSVGQVATTQRVSIEETISDGGGCANAQAVSGKKVASTASQDLSGFVGFAFPFVVGYISTRTRRRKR